MEVQIDKAVVIAADGATPSGLLDEHALDLLKSASDGFPRAPLASPSALAASA
jgi:hypothetical protein